QEKRKFPPPKALVKSAVMSKKAIYAEAAKNPVKFWEQRARELTWFKPWKKALEWKPPYSKWFIGGKLNVAYNSVDRHAEGPRQGAAQNEGGADLGRGARRLARSHLLGPLPRGEPLRLGAQAPRRAQGRPHHDLHADGARAADRDAGLRPDRGGPQRDLRRL